jgi:hypothetical protein
MSCFVADANGGWDVVRAYHGPMPRISAATIGEHRAQTRDRILQAVSRLSRTQGIDAMSMTDVANEAGITSCTTTFLTRRRCCWRSPSG